LQVQDTCFKEFPDQCAGCPDYSETWQNQATQLMWLMGTGIVYPPLNGNRITKECKRYHKLKVEYVRE
jgi:hypothetical protein